MIFIFLLHRRMWLWLLRTMSCVRSCVWRGLKSKITKLSWPRSRGPAGHVLTQGTGRKRSPNMKKSTKKLKTQDSESSLPPAPGGPHHHHQQHEQNLFILCICWALKDLIFSPYFTTYSPWRYYEGIKYICIKTIGLVYSLWTPDMAAVHFNFFFSWIYTTLTMSDSALTAKVNISI